MLNLKTISFEEYLKRNEARRLKLDHTNKLENQAQASQSIAGTISTLEKAKMNEWADRFLKGKHYLEVENEFINDRVKRDAPQPAPANQSTKPVESKACFDSVGKNKWRERISSLQVSVSM